MTPAEARATSFGRVADALDAAAYRVTLMRDGQGWNFTRPNKDEPEQLLHRGELAQKLGQLARFNAQGFNVYITPLDPHYHYLVIDDIRGREGLRAVRERGYRPALVQESSPGNYQAVLKVPADPDAPADREAANAWVRQVNRELGDPNFAGAVHPFRLAGLANRKEQYEQPGGRYPFVRPIHTPGGVCEVATEELEHKKRELAGRTADGPSRTTRSDVSREGIERPAELPSEVLERYAHHRHDVESWVRRRGLPRDESRIDFEIARRLARELVPAGQVALAIEAGSPELERRHPDPWAYASTTAAKAAARETPPHPTRRPDGHDIDR